jgi:thymidine kinase
MITLILGPMHSGKTTELLRRLERFYLAQKSTILLRPSIDSRPFLTHSPKDVSWLQEEFVSSLVGYDISGNSAIGIDEGQFHIGLADFCRTYASTDKNIVISALSATSEAEMFDSVVETIPYCDKMIKLNAVCTSCGSEFGSYTYYTIGKKTDKVVVGGPEAYTSLCACCYFERMK